MLGERVGFSRLRAAEGHAGEGSLWLEEGVPETEMTPTSSSPLSAQRGLEGGGLQIILSLNLWTQEVLPQI